MTPEELQEMLAISTREAENDVLRARLAAAESKLRDLRVILVARDDEQHLLRIIDAHLTGEKT